MTDINQYNIGNKDKSDICSGLYFVPTPIGNLRDITVRALDILMHCDVIVCEDSRVTGKLLAAYSIPKKKKIIYNDHASQETKDYIISLADEGRIIAVISDAGTPMISDPGYKLARDAIANGVYITALPGANAILPAIQLSALPCDKFTFGGFLPSKDKAIGDVIKGYVGRPETLVFYDSPKRVEKSCAIISGILTGQSIKIVREISKIYEESISYNSKIDLSGLKGEIVIVIEGSIDGGQTDYDLDDLILKAIDAGQSMKELSAGIAIQTGLKKKDIYNHALTLKN